MAQCPVHEWHQNTSYLLDRWTHVWDCFHILMSLSPPDNCKHGIINELSRYVAAPKPTSLVLALMFAPAAANALTTSRCRYWQAVMRAVSPSYGHHRMSLYIFPYLSAPHFPPPDPTSSMKTRIPLSHMGFGVDVCPSGQQRLDHLEMSILTGIVEVRVLNLWSPSSVVGRGDKWCMMMMSKLHQLMDFILTWCMHDFISVELSLKAVWGDHPPLLRGSHIYGMYKNDG